MRVIAQLDVTFIQWAIFLGPFPVAEVPQGLDCVLQ